jgi:hypothetical protein
MMILSEVGAHRVVFGRLIGYISSEICAMKDEI